MQSVVAMADSMAVRTVVMKAVCSVVKLDYK